MHRNGYRNHHVQAALRFILCATCRKDSVLAAQKAGLTQPSIFTRELRPNDKTAFDFSN